MSLTNSNSVGADISNDPKNYLESVGKSEDSEVDLAAAALAFASIDRPGLSLERYSIHLQKLAKEVGLRHEELLKAGADDNVETQLAALKHVLVDGHDYGGDEGNYDNLENANLVGVIDRGKGMPVTLSILYIHTGKAQGWDIAGLNIPGHFACRLQKDGQVVIFDPFSRCRILQASDIRKLVKKALGEHAELSSDYHDPMPNKNILIRLQNNIKLRQIEMEDYKGALQTVEMMRLIAPEEYRLFLDAGVLYAKLEQLDSAVDALESYIEQAPDARDRADAAQLLAQIKESLHP
ncbi:MAG: hypothetical protein DHS20C02_08050 [Micavibrio sp.]|nr:MAG: hypothetical protein DHS20C02_08050 [Micavibrio sp.]